MLEPNLTVDGLPDESPEEIARDIAAVGGLEAVPTLLDVLCETTGMRFAAVSRVTDASWTLCAVKDDIDFGLQPGGQLDVETTLCIEAKRTRTPILIEHASVDPVYRDHPTPKLYHIESYVSVPIVLASGRYFGNLCAIDPQPAKLSDPRTLNMFRKFAALIALQLDSELQQETTRLALRDERAAGELREQFIAILGHDLRNPLQAVFATGELIQRKSADPAVQKMAGRILTNLRRMSGLIDDVLDFARARLGGGLGVETALVEDLNVPLLAVAKEFQDAQPDRQILADIRVDRAVRCDVRRLQQVVSNLLGNALSHGASSTPIRICAHTADGELVIEVWNSGDPIPRPSLDRIFEPFWRRSKSGSREGLGLGLYICRQIVDAHGGGLAVTSNRDEGTTFTVRLPTASPAPP